jgi:hypothetical protein
MCGMLVGVHVSDWHFEGENYLTSSDGSQSASFLKPLLTEVETALDHSRNCQKCMTSDLQKAKID